MRKVLLMEKMVGVPEWFDYASHLWAAGGHEPHAVVRRFIGSILNLMSCIGL